MNNSKLQILIFIDWFDPAYKAGGPVRSVSNLVNSLTDKLDFSIITSDRDLGDKVAFKNVEKDVWIEHGKYRVMYLSPEFQKVNTYLSALKDSDYDFIYLNSMFSSGFTIRPLIAIKKIKYKGEIILSPRGMLGQGALNIKPIKKKLFLLLSKWIGFFNNVSWHATSKNEKEEIQEQFGFSRRIELISNIPSLFYEPLKRKKEEGSLNLLFYSRISPKKNLIDALEILLHLTSDAAIIFNIYGPIEDKSYWKECEALIKEIQSIKQNIEIHFGGSINPNEMDKVFKSNHVLFFPTKHENYGHVIAESMSSGMPVILSDNTPWKNLELKRAGYDLKIEKRRDWHEAISFFIEMNQENYNIWSTSASNFAHTEMSDPEVANRYFEMFS